MGDEVLELRQLIPLALSVNTVAVMWLAGSRRALGWALGVAGQALWFVFVVVFSAWGLLPLVIALTVVYARNLWRWTYGGGSVGLFKIGEPHRPYRWVLNWGWVFNTETGMGCWQIWLARPDRCTRTLFRGPRRADTMGPPF